MDEETVNIPKSALEEFVKDSDFLSCLREAGVDNWQGYSVAIKLYTEEFEEDDA